MLAFPTIPEESLPVIPEDRAFGTPFRPTTEENKKQDSMHLLEDGNWILHHGFSESNKMAYFLPIHEICTKSPTKDDIIAIIEECPTSLMVPETSSRRLPLHIACRTRASDEVIKTLLSYCPGAAKLQDSLGRLPLHYACANNASHDVIDALIQAYPQGCAQPCAQGWLPLHISISVKRDFYVVKMLLFQCPETMTKETNGGNTALSLAKHHANNPHGKFLYSFLSSVYRKIAQNMDANCNCDITVAVHSKIAGEEKGCVKQKNCHAVAA